MTDDTDLARPPRHERARSTRRAPRKTPVAPVQGSSTATCACGATVELKIDGVLFGPLRELAIRQLAGTVPVECGACADASEERERLAEQQAVIVARVEARRAAAGIPPKWAAQRFVDLEDDTPRVRALARAREWAAGDVQGLVLWGPVGRGKTAIAAAAANERMAVSAVRWLPVAELLLDLRMPFSSTEYTRAARRLDASGGRAALVLDDLDKLKPTEHAVQPLYVAVNGWIEAGLPLLVTLNRDLDALASWMPDTFGEAIASRLAGYCKVQQVGGVDRRLA